VLEAHLDDEGRAAIDVVFGVIDRHIGSGFLPTAPREEACRWCDYRLICGPNEEARTRRKGPDALADLRRLRSLP